MVFETLFSLITPLQFCIACLIALGGGFVKGATGFAMPVILLSGLGSFLAPELALAGLMLPTLFSNLWQSLRGGFGAALASIKLFRRYITSLLLMILLSAQVLVILPTNAVFFTLGAIVVALAALMLSGFAPNIPSERRGTYDVVVGGLSGLIGGISGIWGPPTVTYLTAINTPKKEHVRVAGVVFGAGSVMLLLAHIGSGVMNAQSVHLSAALVFPSLAGMALGNVMQDRLDQQKFKRLTLIVLVIVGLNLMRRAIF